MRIAAIFQQTTLAGILEELAGGRWRFTYEPNYAGKPVSLTMPVEQATHEFNHFPPVFEGMLPEGEPLEALLRRCKIDRNDFFQQLVTTGQDLVGSLTVREIA